MNPISLTTYNYNDIHSCADRNGQMLCVGDKVSAHCDIFEENRTLIGTVRRISHSPEPHNLVYIEVKGQEELETFDAHWCARVS